MIGGKSYGRRCAVVIGEGCLFSSRCLSANSQEGILRTYANSPLEWRVAFCFADVFSFFGYRWLIRSNDAGDKKTVLIGGVLWVALR